ncbi:MAG: DUF2764 domain-containing protein [Bacteroidales bacterium]|nr:DUF2764 domain-containing protein [Bacteroidales bacterium]
MEKLYTYLVASLPELSLEFGTSEHALGAKNFDFEKIMTEIWRCIDKEDAKHLRLLLLGLESPTPFLYQKTAKSKNRFIREFFMFDVDLRNIQAGVVARRTGQTVDAYLVGNSMITEAILTDKGSDFGLESDDIKRVIAILENRDILEREQKMDLLRWEKVNELSFYSYFNADAVLAFVVKAFLINRWIQLDKERGAAMFRQLLQECRGVSTFVKMPES